MTEKMTIRLINYKTIRLKKSYNESKKTESKNNLYIH